MAPLNGLLVAGAWRRFPAHAVLNHSCHHPTALPLLRRREFELTCGQAQPAGADLGGGLRLSPAAAALDAAAQEELAALSLDPPSALTPELQQLQGQDQVGRVAAVPMRIIALTSFPGSRPGLAAFVGSLPHKPATGELPVRRGPGPSPTLRFPAASPQLQVRRQLHAAIRQVVREERLDPAAAALLYALSARIEKPLHAGGGCWAGGWCQSRMGCM